MIKLTSQQIRSITPDGLTFNDDSGAEHFISFNACFQNFLKRSLSRTALAGMKTANRWNDAELERYKQELLKWKEIAARNIFPEDGGPYIEFYTDPPIRFDFETQDEFSRVRGQIEDAEWRTFDRG